MIRFINCFTSLSVLDIQFAFDTLQHKGQILPKPSCANTRFLTCLRIDLKPGVSGLIAWLLNAKPILTQLRILVLSVWNVQDRAEFRESFGEVQRMLDSCRDTIEDLRLHLNRVPMVGGVSNISKNIHIFLTLEPYSCVSAVQLDPFSNLKSLRYGSCVTAVVLPYAIQQLGAVTSRRNLVQITFDISLHDPLAHLDEGQCRLLDNLLSGSYFPSLEVVFLRKRIAFQLFPKLCKAGLLRVLPKSFWDECV